MFTVQAEAHRQRAEALEITRAAGLSRPIAVPAEGMADALQTRPDMLLDDPSMAVLVGTGLFDQATSRSRLGETGLFVALAFFGAPLDTTRAQRCSPGCRTKTRRHRATRVVCLRKSCSMRFSAPSLSTAWRSARRPTATTPFMLADRGAALAF